MVSYRELSVALYCWQFGHSAAAEAKLALISWTHTLSSSLLQWTLHSCAQGPAPVGQWLRQMMSTGQFIQSSLLFSASSVVDALWWVLHGIQRPSLFMLTLSANMSIHRPLFQTSCGWSSNISSPRTIASSATQTTQFWTSFVCN